MTQDEFDKLYEGLNREERIAFDVIAINPDDGITLLTFTGIESLHEKGLVVYCDGFRSFVPLAVHILWCDWCARNVELPF